LPKRPVGPGPVAAEVTPAATGDADRPFAFSPPEVTVPAGSAVRWVNADDVFHTVTSTASLQPRRPSGLFDRPLARGGDRFQFSFTRPGVYHYYCRPHSDFMWGAVRAVG